MSRKFIITGRHRLTGEYPIQGNKNAALPLISATLLARARVVFHNVPKIKDVENQLALLQVLGVKVRWQGERLSLDSRCLEERELPADRVEKLRGTILLLGPLAALWGRISCVFPGGCPIGRRSFEVHWSVFRAAGLSVHEKPDGIEIKKTRNIVMPRVYLQESSVTATENALLLFSALGGGMIQNPAREPHVLVLIDFLRRLGCEIELHPLYYRVAKGVSETDQIEFRVPADYIDAGTIAIASAVTGGNVLLKGVLSQDLIGIQSVLESFGVHFQFQEEDVVKIITTSCASPAQVISGPWPSFPTDLISLAIVLATQSRGICLIHDWMYESRMFFVDKLVRMGGRVTMCDPHRVLVEGPTVLRGTRLESPDIRAGMALVVAGLCAEGITTIEHAEVILRGYQSVAERLRLIRAKICET